MRNSVPLPELTICPGSTPRVSTRPSAGATMLRRAVLARNWPSVARATRTCATAASRVAVN
jgi:hypothetical protein